MDVKGNFFFEVLKTISDLEPEIRLFVVFFSAGLSKQQSTYPEEQFDEKQLLEKRILFWSFSDNERRTSGCLAISFRLSCQSCLLRVGSNFRGEKTLEKNSFVKFGYWTKILWLLSNFLQRGCKNCLLRVHRKKLKEKKVSPKKMSFTKLSQTPNISGLWLESFWRGFQNCIIRVH